MQQLPIEILRLIFSYLFEKDLVQCQLTCKEWYLRSVEYLYARPTANTAEKASLFIRTISDSLRLGSYVKSIDTFKYSNMFEQERLLSDYDSIDTLIRQCPNITSFERYNEEVSYWVQLSRAAGQGQLSRLEYLPTSTRSQSLEPYLNTALNFKASLKELDIRDYEGMFGNDLDRLDVYQTLQNQISKFEKLERLNIAYRSNKQLSDFDSMIDGSPRLKHINISLITDERDVTTVEPVKPILICPSMRTVSCNWNMIDDDNHLRYIMQKFPNLRYLNIENCNQRPNRIYCSHGAVTKFLTYVIAKIPKFMICLEIRKADLLPVYLGLAIANLLYLNIEISYTRNENSSDKVFLNIAEDSLEIMFPLHEDDIELPHIEFFSRVGCLIQSLMIQNFGDFDVSTSESSPIHDAITSDNWVYEILQVCPRLQELIISNPINEVLVCSNFSKCPQVRKLSVCSIQENDWSLDFLRTMSVNLPNLEHLDLIHSCDDLENSQPIKIDMEYSNLNLITWDNDYCVFPLECYSEVYILMSSDIELKYYQGNKTKLSEITQVDYASQFRKKLCFEILCGSLKEFIINHEGKPLYKWSFPI